MPQTNNDAPERIDVHHHILPPAYVDALKEAGAAESSNSPLPPWSLDATLRLMERQHITRAVLSISSPGIFFGDNDKAAGLARQMNETLSDLVREHPDRFAALAILPLPDVDAALSELAYALNTLHLRGVILLASVGGHYVADPAFAPVWDELNRRHTPVLLHPNTPPGYEQLGLDLPAFLLEFPFDTTRAMTQLIATSTLDRCPNVPIVAAHAGGTIPYLAGRLALGQKLSPQLKKNTSAPMLDYLRRFHYDTAISATPQAWAALRAIVPPGHVLFGTDYPYQDADGVAETIDGVDALFDLTAIERQAVNADNARAVFGL